jgi:sulfotransferase famil protein
MISETHRAIFIHIPKCAGISVRSVLRRWGFSRPQLNQHAEDIRSGFYKRGTAERLHRHADRALWDSSFKFCVCRNPYDRLVSGWSFCRKNQHLNVGFPYFVRYMHTFDAFSIVWHCRLPQRQHIVIDDVPVVDAVCRLETLDRDFEAIKVRLKVTSLTLPHRNRSAHSPYREYYTKELQDIVFERFRVDFDYFGYDYEL